MAALASDQGFLPAPVPVTRLSLAPGERREILVDMSKGKEVAITTVGEAVSLIDRIRSFFESSILVNTTVLTIKPTGLLPIFTDNLPIRLMSYQLIKDSIKRPGLQGSFERWIVHTNTPQAFHIQGGAFLI